MKDFCFSNMFYPFSRHTRQMPSHDALHTRNIVEARVAEFNGSERSFQDFCGFSELTLCLALVVLDDLRPLSDPTGCLFFIQWMSFNVI